MSDELPPILYGPRNGQSLLRTYPELKEHTEFTDLSKEDLHFAWLMGIKGSPVSEDMAEESRIRSAALQAFPGEAKQDKRNEFSRGGIPVDVRAAISKFSNMSPNARLMAKRMTQMVFEKYQQLLNVDVENDFLIRKKVGKGQDVVEVTEMDWTGRKAYADSSANIIKTLPELVKKIEEGYGVTEKNKDGETQENKTIHKFHSQKITT